MFRGIKQSRVLVRNLVFLLWGYNVLKESDDFGIAILRRKELPNELLDTLV